MWQFLGRRLFTMALTMWGLATAVFLMIKAIPGDEASVAAGEGATPEMIEAVRERLGLDQPIYVQYVEFLGRLLRGDLGVSLASSQEISDALARVLPSTIELVVMALIFVIVLAFPAALLMAAYAGKAVDVVGRILTVVLAGMPIFWAGFMIQRMAAESRALPISGVISVQYSVPRVTGFTSIDALIAGQPAAFVDVIQHLILPALVLSVIQAAVIVRTLRASVINELQEDYVSLARSKGASTPRIVVRHALRNASVATIATLGLQVGYLMAGSVLIESVFARPGIGSYLATAVTQKDTFAVLGSVLFIGVVIIVMSFIVDLLQLAIDPRVRAAAIASKA